MSPFTTTRLSSTVSALRARFQQELALREASKLAASPAFKERLAGAQAPAPQDLPCPAQDPL